MKTWLNCVAISTLMMTQAFGTILLQDDFTGRSAGTALGGTSVKDGLLSGKYEGSKGWSFSYGDGFISAEDVESGVANRSLTVPFSVAEIPYGEDVLVLDVTADPSVFRKSPSFSLQFGLKGQGSEEIWYTFYCLPSGATQCYAKYIDGKENAHSLLGITAVSKDGGPFTFAIKYDRKQKTVSLIVNGTEKVSDLSLIDEFGSAPMLSSLSFRAIRAGADTRGKALYHSFRLESMPSDSAVAGANVCKWETRSSASVRLAGENVVCVSYDNQADKVMDLLPIEPTPLPDQLVRIKLWYAQILGGLDISFLIRDAAGALHDVPATHDTGIQPWMVGWEPDQRGNWALWTQTESVALRMPDEKTIDARMTPEDAAVTKALLWPKPWTLEGLRLTKSKNGDWGSSSEDRAAMRDGKGTLLFSDLKFETQTSFEAESCGKIIELLRWSRNEPMRLFLDDLVMPAGRGAYSGPLRYSIKVRKGYQGSLVWEQKGAGILDRTNPVALKEQVIELPQLPIGKYYIQTDAFNPDGEHLENRLYQWAVVEGPEVQPPQLTETLRVETGQPNHVYDSSAQKAVLTIKQEDTRGTDLYEIDVRDFKGNPMITREIPVSELSPLVVPVTAGFDYFVTVKAVKDTSPRVVNEVALLHFGVANTPETKKPYPDMPSIDQLLKGKNEPHVEYWNREHANLCYPWYSNMDMEDIRKWSDHVKTFGWDIVAIRTLWPCLEMLPGVTRFQEIDELVDYAAQNGQKVMLGCSIWGNRGEAVWADWLPIRDQYGDFTARPFPASAFDKASKNGKTRFMATLANHYNDNPTVVGYHILGVSLSGEEKPDELRRDYARASREVFAQWLADKGRPVHPMPEPLTVPLIPISQLGPDLSLEWLNMTEFLAYANVSAVKGYIESIRSVDKQRPIIVDRKPSPWAAEALVPMLREDGNATLKNEGSPRFGDVALRTMTMQAGVPYLGELHRHVPTSEALADVISFWEALWADCGFWLQRWRYKQFMEDWAPDKDSVFNEVPAVMNFVKDTQPHWDQFMTEPFEVPEVLVFGSRASENLGGQRRGFFDDFTGLATFSALFRQHQIPVFAASEYTDWVKLENFKVIFVEGYIQTQAAMDRLINYAKAGGKLVLVGDAGKYTVGNYSQRDYLRKQVGGLKNVWQIDPAAPLVIPGVKEWETPKVFDREKLESILKWAGVKRPASVTSESAPGFEVATRRSDDGRHVYVGVMRSWYGWYRNHIEKRDVLRKLFGMGHGTVTVNGLSDGKWQVRKFHRDVKDLGVFTAKNGSIQFETDDAEAAEVQLYELTLMNP